MKKTTKFSEPKGVLEVREWKRKVSANIERMGYEEFHKQAEKKHRALFDRIEAARLAKLKKVA